MLWAVEWHVQSVFASHKARNLHTSCKGVVLLLYLH